MNYISMIRNASLSFGLLTIFASSSRGELEIKTSVTSFSIQQLPEDGGLTREKGTQVILELSSLTEEKKLTGASIDPTKITFKDSTGKDLFVAGKKTRAAYDENGGGFGGLRPEENSLSVMTPSTIGRDEAKPGIVHLRCYALATPAANASGVTIQGEIKVFTESDQTKTGMITKAQLTSGKEIKLGDATIEFRPFGGGSVNGRRFTWYEFSSLAALKKIEVAGKTAEESPVVIEKEGLRVYADELTDTDQIEITYALPIESALEINVDVTPGSVGN